MKEYQHQTAVIKWSQQPKIREKYPALAMLYHVPNERKCTPQQGAMLRRMGVKKGVPDLVLPAARCGYHGLYIEMKNETGRLSDDQKWWADKLHAENYKCDACYSYAEAIDCLVRYLEGVCLEGGVKNDI